MITLRELVNAGSELAGKVCAGFAGTDGDYKYIIGSQHGPAQGQGQRDKRRHRRPRRRL